MSYSESSRRRGRPRDEALDAHILSTVNELLTERGYDGVSYEEVARRAGASKPTLYRRWATKRDMVVAAVKAGPAGRDDDGPIDTGSLRGDLLALCRRLLTTMQSTDGQTALALLEAGFDDPELGETIEQTVGPTGARLPASVVAAAVARGELPEGVDPFAFEEVTGSVLLLRRLNGLATPPEYLEALVDAVLIPALQASAKRTGALPAGIFSGRTSGDAGA
ncbi:TetR/AcrR family transcriptional regulator [Leifsonia sp. SIMBA_070]|uniref:TetR/AcrR family transcriptional regulator n=1 Tax=Leifsonia sp. SIMBA_070 TaxID=3085810 RepID=UPI00397E8312